MSNFSSSIYLQNAKNPISKSDLINQNLCFISLKKPHFLVRFKSVGIYTSFFVFIEVSIQYKTNICTNITPILARSFTD